MGSSGPALGTTIGDPMAFLMNHVLLNILLLYLGNLLNEGNPLRFPPTVEQS